MKSNEAKALILAAGIYLQRYKGANSALKEAKSALLDHMDTENIINVEGEEPGSGARIIEKAGNRTLLLAEMSDELVLWCARNGVLAGAVGEFDKLPDEQRNALTQYVGHGAPSRYVDLYFPSWGAAAQTKKETARAQNTATPLPQSPPLVAAPTPIKNARQAHQERAQQPQPAADGANCPEHPNRKPKASQFKPGVYCTARTEDGFCKWTADQLAS